MTNKFRVLGTLIESFTFCLGIVFLFMLESVGIRLSSLKDVLKFGFVLAMILVPVIIELCRHYKINLQDEEVAPSDVHNSL